MNIITFIKIIVKRLKYILIIPILVGGLSYYLTRNLPVKYSTTASIFTGITSNAGLDVEENKIDNVATQNEYNNVLVFLSSKTLLKEVGLKLLTQHLMLDKAQKDIISDEAFAELQKNVPQKIKSLIVKNNFELSYTNLYNSIKQDEKNYIYRLLNFNNPYYSLPVLTTIKNTRVSNSDLINLAFESNDPGICYNTLKFTTEIFIKNYSELKKHQSSSAVEYFSKKLAEIAEKLSLAEDRLLTFNIENNVINYYEQTEQVTTQQEKIEIRLQEVKMEFQAAKAVLNQLEIEIKNRFKINLRNKDILDIRQELIAVNNEISKKQLIDIIQPTKNIDVLDIKKSIIETRLKNSIDSIYNFNSNSQGIESQRILGEWLDALKNYESFSALYKSMMERQIEFMLQYKKYAPLGATIKRIEREIDVYEREYLNILNSLNSAKQNQQNTNMLSNMKILDSPEFPISSMPTKRSLYILASVLIAEIFYLLGVFIILLMDSRVKNPALLKKHTGLEVLAGFSTDNVYKKTNTEGITKKATTFIYNKISALSSHREKPFIIQIISVWEKSGKSTVAENIFKELERLEYKTKLINFSNEGEHSTSEDNRNYTNTISVNDMDFVKSDNYNTILNKVFKSQDFDYIICELPPLCCGVTNSTVLKSADLNLIIFDANTAWSKADTFNLNRLKECTNANLFAILTNAIPDNLEEMYGDIYKKRSKTRIYLRKLIKRYS